MQLAKTCKTLAAAAAGLSLFAAAGSWGGSPPLLQAQAAATPCADGAVDTLVASINDYRDNASGFNRNIGNWPATQSLISVPDAQKGEVRLPTDANLMK